MWQLIRRRHESNARYLNWIIEALRSKAITPVGIFEDWQDDLDFLKIEYNLPVSRNELNISKVKKFYEEQLAIHKRKHSDL